MLLGCGEWGFRNHTLPDYFRTATALGFRHLEFGIGGGWPGRLPEAPTPNDIADFRALAARHGVATRHCCLENDFTRPAPAEHAEQLRKVLAQLPAAAACGANTVRLFAGFTPAEEITDAIWDRLLAALRSAAAGAADNGLTLAIETHGGITANADGSATHRHTVSTRRDLLARLLREMPPEIGVNYDPGNLKAADPADTTYAADLVAGRVNYCHLKDWKRSGAGWLACAPGDDDLDYSTLLPLAGFDGPYLVEYEPLEDTLDGFRRSLAYLTRTFPDATTASPTT